MCDSVFIPLSTALFGKDLLLQVVALPMGCVKCGQKTHELHLGFRFTLAETRWRTAPRVLRLIPLLALSETPAKSRPYPAFSNLAYSPQWYLCSCAEFMTAQNPSETI